MLNLIVVPSIKNFLFAANIDFIVEYAFTSDAVIAVVQKFIVNVTLRADQAECVQMLERSFPDAKLKFVKNLPAANILTSPETTEKVDILMEGTAFQEKVWRALVTIPRGTTVFYSDVAKMAGNASAVRAAATAVGKNPVAVLVPCHRVIGKSNPFKFGAGPEMKKKLLKEEGVFLE